VFEHAAAELILAAKCGGTLRARTGVSGGSVGLTVRAACSCVIQETGARRVGLKRVRHGVTAPTVLPHVTCFVMPKFCRNFAIGTDVGAATLTPTRNVTASHSTTIIAGTSAGLFVTHKISAMQR
jgi:hypothetical protein